MVNLLPIKIFSWRNESEMSEEIRRAPKGRRSTPSATSRTKRFQQSLFKYVKHLRYFCKYINKIEEDEYTELTNLLEKIKKLDFSLAKRISQLRPLAQLLKKLRIMRASEDVMISLRGANESLRRAASRIIYLDIETLI